MAVKKATQLKSSGGIAHTVKTPSKKGTKITAPLSKYSGIKLSPRKIQGVKSQVKPLQTRNVSQVQPMKPPQPVAPQTVSRPTRNVWYLGGNHLVKLLTSVEGDLDPSLLSNLGEVPAVVGELALSVESLVSDDFTIGGFESDLLAKIASNTMSAKKGKAPNQANRVTAAPVAPEVSVETLASTRAVSAAPKTVPKKAVTKPIPTSRKAAVPNPLSNNYKPVPNPLAFITPASSSSAKGQQPGAKLQSGANQVQADASMPMIQAR